MNRRVQTALSWFWAADRGLSAFLALLILFTFVLPLLVKPMLMTGLVFSLLLIAGVATVSEQRWVLLAVSAAVAAALIVRWADWLLPAADLAQWHAASLLVTFGLFSVVVLAQVFRSGPVTIHRIQGAIAVYLLLGLAWASAYQLVALRHPDAFTGAIGGEGGSEGMPQHWIYYSFVTLTTLGYGDITPVHPVARSLAVLEALVGQLYPAILLARLVSLQVHLRRDVK